MSFRRIPKEIDPRRPPKRRKDRDQDPEDLSEARSYGQYIEVSPEELAELERATEEVAREGAAGEAESGATRREQRSLEEREAFEDATDEVSREDEDLRR
ncbi:hypothetical protein BH23CHL2_BH23CHL2_30980 [soil metagenome]